MEAQLTADPDTPQGAPPAPAPVPVPARTRWWTGRRKAVATFGVLTLLLIAAETGTVGFAVGLLMATLPLPLYVAIALWLDRFEAEPRGMLVRAFAWGAARTPNPLNENYGLPSACMLDTVFGAANLDLTPGLEARASCPEAIWIAANYWQDYYKQFRGEVPQGRFWTPHGYPIEEPRKD